MKIIYQTTTMARILNISRIFFLPHNQVGKTPKLSFNYNYPSTISPSISVYFENQQCYLPLGKNCWNFVTEYAKAFAKQQSLKPSSAFDPQEQTAVPTQHKAENKSKDAVPSTGHLNKTLPQSQSVSSPNHTPTRVVRCSTCGALSPHFVCSGCAKEWYCNAKCQLKQWRHHSKFCLKK
ncbi:uncharacterized protein LOC143255575 [Tachypleus tridentatus]|uniref:uncharacterized protein LOC143255575 n=1 Tax=Tachypleus tridentatus TaxID=6853 RepID=UPI003FD3C446